MYANYGNTAISYPNVGELDAIWVRQLNAEAVQECALVPREFMVYHERMNHKELEKAQSLLSNIMEFELAGVVRYTHYSLMVTGPHRIPIVTFMKAQANESLMHAQQVGEILTGLDGHPSLKIAPIAESHEHSVQRILEESLDHERQALKLYKQLLTVVKDKSIYLEEFARSQIAQEELHGLELHKMLRDIGIQSDSILKREPSFKKRKR